MLRLVDIMEFLKDEAGENSQLSQLLLLALIVIPLILLVVFFGNELVEMATTAWEEVPTEELEEAVVKVRPSRGRQSQRRRPARLWRIMSTTWAVPSRQVTMSQLPSTS